MTNAASHLTLSTDGTFCIRKEPQPESCPSEDPRASRPVVEQLSTSQQYRDQG